MDVSIVLPAYQEEENLKLLLPRIKETLDNTQFSYEIIVVDTQDPMDNTKVVCAELNARHSYRRNGNMYGDAIRTGFFEASGKYIVVMDCDGSHEPHELVPMLGIVESGADLVIGSRYVKGGHTDNNWVLRFMSLCVNVAYRVIFGLKVKDVSDSFRVYKYEQVKNLTLECDHFDLVEEILIKLAMANPKIKIVEHPISFRKRMYGDSKRDLVKFFLSYAPTIVRLYRMKTTVKEEGKFHERQS